jgi:hypothetical protein
MQSLYNEPSDSPDNEMKMCEGTSSSDECSHPPVLNDWVGNTGNNQGDLKVYTQTSLEVGGGLSEEPTETHSNRVREFSWTNPSDETSVALASRPDRVRSPKFYHSPNWILPSPVKTKLPTPPAPEYTQCRFWEKANSIYARIFDYDREKILAANTVDSGALFKVVKDGWGSLTPRERDNPVLEILQEVDQNLFWDLDPVTKIANLYKSHLILKVSLS